MADHRQQPEIDARHRASISGPNWLLLLDRRQFLSSGDTAWMLASTAFILLMTLPGRARLYAGVVQSKPVLSGDAMLLHHRHSNPVMVFRRLQPLLILKALNLVMGQVRVDPEAEIVGLDLAAHGERGYEL